MRGWLGRVLHRLESAESLPGADQVVAPGPAAWQVQTGAAGVAGDARGDVQDAVAKPFRLPPAGRAGAKQQALCPADQVLAREHELEPDGVLLERAERYG